MLKLLALIAALAVPGLACAQSAPPAPIEVMVLASPHLNNPGRDVHNARLDPVTTPAKQAELAVIAEDLARFQPTLIAIERVAPDPATLIDAFYTDYDPADLATDADERVQIGYRLAARLRLAQVHAIDEKDRPGEPTYFPYGEMAAWAQSNGRANDLGALGGKVRAWLADMEQRQRTMTLGQLFAEINAPDHPMAASGQGSYYEFLRFGAGDVLPGAELNGRWYTRNAKIFAKLMQAAEPGDRVVVLFGAGHAYWLRHFVQTTPGFVLIEPTAYLSER